jgi:hypothetical protein
MYFARHKNYKIGNIEWEMNEFFFLFTDWHNFFEWIFRSLTQHRNECKKEFKNEIAQLEIINKEMKSSEVNFVYF